MAGRQAPSPTQSVAPPLYLHRLRQQLRKAGQARAEREARMAECERLLRRHEKPPEELFQAWLDGCAAESVDPEMRLDRLLRPVQERLAELLAERAKDWPSPDDPPRQDRLLCRQLSTWGALEDPRRLPLVYELVTYLEDAREEHWRRQAARSTWKVAEAEQADAVVVALQAVLSETFGYVKGLTGDDPRVDPRIAAVLRLLFDVRKRLRQIEADPKPRAEGEGRPVAGSRKNWPAEVVREVRNRLAKIRPWGEYEDPSKAEHRKMLTDLAERIVARLGIRAARGFGSAKAQRLRPPANPRHDLIRRLGAALGVQRRRPARRSR